MIYSPHEDAEDRVAGAEHLHLLLDKVFLFGFGFGGQNEHGAGGAGGVPGSRHHAAAVSTAERRSPSLLSASAVTHSPTHTHLNPQLSVLLR